MTLFVFWIPEIATCYGSDMTEHALNHRFRKIRAQALLIKEGRMAGFDMKHLAVEENELPSTKESVHKDSTSTTETSFSCPFLDFSVSRGRLD